MVGEVEVPAVDPQEVVQRNDHSVEGKVRHDAIW